MSHRTYVFIAAMLALFVTSRTFAQNSYGTILGTVVDQSGAVVAGTTVEAQNSATGIISTATTQSDGNYTIVNLIPGPYLVSVSQSGFKKAEAKVILVVNQRLRVDLTLQPGSDSQTVTVSAQGAALDTDSSAITTYIGPHQVTDLPLSSRVFTQLLVLSPGVVPSGESLPNEQSIYRTPQAGGAIFVGGGQGGSNAYRIDGVDDNDPGFQTPTISPSIDAIDAIRLMSKNYSAEYGGSASQINIATKSGTNNYHGTLYDFFRNDALDATDFFARRDPISGRIKPVLRYNQFGGSLGGPVTIPHVFNGHDRLFFFFNYEGLRSHSLQTASGLFATPAELSGDFSGDATIYDPSTGLPFPGNKIPQIDSKAAQIIAMGVFPTPNVAPQPGYNTVQLLSAPNNYDQYTARIDTRIGSKDSLFVRFSGSSQDLTVPALPKEAGILTSQDGKNLAVSYTHIFSPNLVNELRVGLNRPISQQTQVGAFGSDAAGSLFNGTDTAPVTYGLPSMTFLQYGRLGAATSGPLTYTTTDAMIADTMTWIHSAHTFQFGVLGRKLFYKEINAYIPRGQLAFTGIFTAGELNPIGNSVADFLLGFAQTASVNQGNFTGWYNALGWDGFLQDDWKVTTRLTVNLGIRYEYLAPFKEERDRISTFDPSFPGGRLISPNSAAVAQVDSPLIAYTKHRTILNPDRNNFAPRIGFSLRPTERLVVRSGYGVFFDTVNYNDLFFPVMNAPFQKTALVNGVVGSPVSIDTLFPIAQTPTPIPGTMSAYSLAYDSRTPYVQNWNLDIETQLPGHSLFEIGYIGSEASKLHYRRQATQGILSNPGPNATVTFPYPNFSRALIDTTGSSSNYHAVFGHFEKQFSNGYSILANYTYSKALGTSSAVSTFGNLGGLGGQDAWNLRGDYGALGYDVTNNVVLSGIWNLPFGRGQIFANKAPTLANLLIGGWQLNGIYMAHSGFPFRISAVDVSGTNSPAPRADVIGNPYQKDSVDPTRAFNRYAFAQPAPGTFGNSRPDAVRGKGLSNLDLSAFKNTELREGLNLQLRMEAFNVLNNAQIGPIPGTAFSLDPASSFGVYSTLQHEARILQLALKIIF